ncbi:MAG: hypothetical protein R2785_07535 [Flavobacteriaceae bacterium]
MKTKFLKPTSFALLLMLALNNLIAQNSFDASITLQQSSFDFQTAALDDLPEEVDLYAFEETKPLDYYEIQDDRSVAAVLARAMFGLGAGIAFGENEINWCLQAAYYMQLSMFANSALYGVLGAAYEGYSFDDYNRNFIDFQLKLLMFSAITQYKEVFLIYGILGAYGLGNEKFNGFKTDVNRLTLSAIMGFNIILTTNLALALQTSVFTYVSNKYKPESGDDYSNNFTSFLFNKRNIFTLSLLINLSRSRS